MRVLSQFFSFLAMIFLVVNLQAQTVGERTSDSVARKSAEPPLLPHAQPYKARTTSISVFIAPIFAHSGGDFFTEYQKLGGLNRDFSSATAMGAMTKVNVMQGIWAGVSIETYKTNFFESYSRQVFGIQGDTIGQRSISQDMRLRMIPVFLTLEVLPVHAQFKSYAGIGVGIAIANAYWSESVLSTIRNDNRIGGLYADETRVAPAFRIYTGVELGFDRPEQNSFLHSIFMEARFSYTPARFPYFNKVAKQVENPPSAWNDSYSINTGGISLAIGLNLHFHPKK